MLNHLPQLSGQIRFFRLRGVQRLLGLLPFLENPRAFFFLQLPRRHLGPVLFRSFFCPCLIPLNPRLQYPDLSLNFLFQSIRGVSRFFFLHSLCLCRIAAADHLCSFPCGPLFAGLRLFHRALARFLDRGLGQVPAVFNCRLCLILGIAQDARLLRLRLEALLGTLL
ncbi:hypothetical protein [Leisingera caerulea]|uniref:Uncharacterized protein n=1 Tax=Leisingera caerulea TaxID=506591 RepID=A0A9Q9M043_LEICA|nr:hypothetical protein [Leisingera caerulea]UWQ53227.1 hypothetical protein K3721_14650 [Leisingera caerulea]